MSNIKSNTSRRAFFLRGGALMGAGVAGTAGASAMLAGDKSTLDAELEELRSELASLTESEAIRQLHLAFASMVEGQTFDVAAELFTHDATLHLSGVSASGRSDIGRLFADQYRHQKAAVMHSAYRHGDLSKDVVKFGDDRIHAMAIFHVDAALSTPLHGNSTVAQMARLQGQTGTRHWESGRLEGRYVKAQGQWKIASLTYVTA